MVRLLCAKGIDRHVVNKQGHSVIDLVRDVDIGAEIQSYDPIEEPNLEESTFFSLCGLPLDFPSRLTSISNTHSRFLLEL